MAVAKNHGIFGALLCLLLVSLAHAEEPSIPVRLQAGLMAKIAVYDRNMPARAGELLRIGILTKTDNADSVRVANEMIRALGDMGEIAGLPHEESIIGYANAATLP